MIDRCLARSIILALFQIEFERVKKDGNQGQSKLALEHRWVICGAALANAQHPLDEDDVAVLGRLPGGHYGVARPRALIEGEALHALNLEHTRLSE